MSDKELLYVQDALGQMRFLIAQCRSAAQVLGDPELRAEAEKLAQKHTQLFNHFYTLL